MAYVVTKACIGTKDRSCVEVCPVDCFYDIRKKKYNTKYGVEVEGEDGDPAVGMLAINPDECINCGACEPECPVGAIVEDTSIAKELEEFVEINSSETVPLSEDQLSAIRCTGK